MECMLLAATKFSELKGWRWVLGWIFDQIINHPLGQGMVEDMLYLKTSDLTIANGLWDLFGVLALGLAIMGFIFDLDRAMFMAQGNATMLTWFIPFVKFAGCILVLSNASLITGWILSLNNSLIKSAAALTIEDASGGVSAEAAICGAIEEMTIIPAAFIVAPTLLLVYILSIVPSLIMYYNAVVRKLELILRVGFTPVAMADVYKGADSMTVRWLKKFLALGIYGMGMIAVMKIALQLQVTTLATEFSKVLGEDGLYNIATEGPGVILGLVTPVLFAVVVLFAEIGACSMIKQAANEALGC